MFFSMYQSEQIFSLVNSNKSPVSSRLTRLTDFVLKVATSNTISTEIENLRAEKTFHTTQTSKRNF